MVPEVRGSNPKGSTLLLSVFWGADEKYFGKLGVRVNVNVGHDIFAVY